MASPAIFSRRRRLGGSLLHIGALSTGGAALDELQFLQANLADGGDEILALYSTSYDDGSTVGVSAGVVDTWDGVLGTEPQVVFAGAARPAWSAENLTISSDGLSDFGVSATSPLFDLSTPKTIAYVGSAENGDCIGGITVAGFARLELIRMSSNTYRGDFTGAQVDSGVAEGSTRRLVMIAKTSGGTTTGRAEVPDHAAGGPTAISEIASANNDFRMFALQAASGFIVCVARAFLVLDRDYTADDKTVLKSWAQTYHNVTLAT